MKSGQASSASSSRAASKHEREHSTASCQAVSGGQRSAADTFTSHPFTNTGEVGHKPHAFHIDSRVQRAFDFSPPTKRPAICGPLTFLFTFIHTFLAFLFAFIHEYLWTLDRRAVIGPKSGIICGARLDVFPGPASSTRGYLSTLREAPEPRLALGQVPRQPSRRGLQWL